MATTYTSLLGLALPTTGELQGTWGDTVNNSITSLLDTAVAGTTTLSTDGDVTLSTTTGAANQARQAILLCSGARTAQRTITAPAQSKIYTVINATTGGYAVKLVGVGPTTGVVIPAGRSMQVAWNGSDFVNVSDSFAGSGSANGIVYLNGSNVPSTSGNFTYDGTNTLLSGGYAQIISSTITALLRQNTSTSYTSLRLYNDLNSSGRSLEINYTGSAYSGAILTGGPSGEQVSIASIGAYPLSIGTNNTARMIFDGSNGFISLGSSTTAYPLTIRKDAASITDPMLYINPTTGTNASLMIFNNSGSGGFYVGRSNSVGAGSGAALNAYSSFLWNTGSQNIEIGTNNLRAMQIDTTQCIGINTTTVSTQQLRVLASSTNVAGAFIGLGTTVGGGSGANGTGTPLLVSDNSATGSNTTMGGIRFSSSPGADPCLWKLTANTTPYFAFGWDSTNTYARVNTSGYWGFGTNQGPDTNVPFYIRNDAGTATTAMLYVYPNTSNNASYLSFNNVGSGEFKLGRSSSTGQGSSATLGSGDTFIWNTGVQKIYFGTNNTTAMYIDTGQAVYVTNYLESNNIGVVSASNGAGNMKFQCTGTPAGTGYVGINAYTNSVFALGSASGTNWGIQFYTNGGLAGSISTARGNASYRMICFGRAPDGTAAGTNNTGGLSAGMGNNSLSNRNDSVVVSGWYNGIGGSPQWISNWASNGAWALGSDSGSNDSYLRFGLWAEDSNGVYWTGTYSKLKVDTLTQTSDYRIKENVRPYEQDALAALRLFAPKRFNKIVHDDPTNDKPPVIRDEIGYIAHEVQEHIPELVTGVKDGVDAAGNPIIQGLDYDRMGAVLHRAVLQLEDKLIALQAQFDAYKASHP